MVWVSFSSSADPEVIFNGMDPQGDLIGLLGNTGSIRARKLPAVFPRRAVGSLYAPVIAVSLRECAQSRDTNSFPARNVTYEVLDGKCRFGQSIGVTLGLAGLGGVMTI